MPSTTPLDLAGSSIDLTRQLCDIESVSGNESVIADAIEASLAGCSHLEIIRDGDAVIARTNLGRAQRVVIAGHIDTVPVAGRQVWLQHLPPDQVPACGPGLDYMLDVMPVSGVIRKVMTGSGECANVDWAFLGLSMPAWSLVWFVLLAAWAAFAAFTRRGMARRR